MRDVVRKHPLFEPPYSARRCQTRNGRKERPDHYFPSRSVEYQRRRRRQDRPTTMTTTTATWSWENDAGKKATRPGCHCPTILVERRERGRRATSSKLSASATFARVYHCVVFFSKLSSGRSCHVKARDTRVYRAVIRSFFLPSLLLYLCFCLSISLNSPSESPFQFSKIEL